MTLKQQLTGTGVAIVTPFKDNGSIDFHSFENLIEFQIKNGINYLVFLGTTGESTTIKKEEKKAIVNFAYNIVKERVPIVIGIGGSNTAELMKDFKLMPLDQATAILSVCPYYNKPSQEGIFKHYKALAQTSPKPIIIYNVPGRTGVNINASTVIKLALEVENIIGVKEASGNLQQCITILNHVPKTFLVVTGDDHIVVPSIAAGMHGVISVVANAFPKEYVNMVNAALQFKMQKAQDIQKLLYEVCDLCFIENNPAGIKAFLYELDLCANSLRLPLVPLQANHQDRVRQFVKNYLKK